MDIYEVKKMLEVYISSWGLLRIDLEGFYFKRISNLKKILQFAILGLGEKASDLLILKDIKNVYVVYIMG